MTYQVTKTYSPEAGFSCVFRQWRANSHCRYLHGYALGISITFECEDTQRDHNGWVVDFGGLKGLKSELVYLFDHTTLVANDDPMSVDFLNMADAGLMQLRQLPAVGCEAFAKHVFDMSTRWVDVTHKPARDVRVASVTVFEHTGNSATYKP